VSKGRPLTAREYYVRGRTGSSDDFESCLRHLLREYDYKGRAFVYGDDALTDMFVTNAPVALVNRAASLSGSRIVERLTAMCTGQADCEQRPTRLNTDGYPVCDAHAAAASHVVQGAES
jgi:hypothetical protein